MSIFDELLSEAAIATRLSIASKKKALEQLSALLAPGDQTRETSAFESLCARERLGGTGLGFGVALPHGRIPELERSVGAIVTLESGIDFDAPDGGPVDILFGLLVPEQCNNEHLQILARVAQMFSDESLRENLREQSDPEKLRETLIAWEP